MKRVIMIGEEPKEDKPLELTHRQGVDGWAGVSNLPDAYDKILYLGKCYFDGDMFAAYTKTSIEIFKGHLNNGTY